MLNLYELKTKMIEAIRITGLKIENVQLEIIDRGMPHKPAGLPMNKMGIYAFIYQDHFLKIGKAGPNSDARFRSQHYNPLGSQSNLAKSILSDFELASLLHSPDSVGGWIRQNTRRIDFFIGASLGIFALNFFESFLHLMYSPKYEGFENQRKIIAN